MSRIQPFAALALVLSFALFTQAQAPPAAKGKIPPPENVSLMTKDGVALKAIYFPSPNEKKAIPVIMLHGWKGKKEDVAGLAAVLQKQEGYAVIVPDLRTHGASQWTIQLNDRVSKTIDTDDIKRQQMQLFMDEDMEAVKRFLMDQNNEGKLNIDLLTIVAADNFSSILAANWAAKDWSWPILAGLKQGQDVKALVLVSPETTFKGFSASQALNHSALQTRVSIMLVASEESRNYSDAKQIEKQLSRGRLNASADGRDLFLATKPGDAKGTALLMNPAYNVLRDIKYLVDNRVAARADEFPWTDRSSPLGK
ncbi:alpha/beta hydrolase [Blastopirellula sp. JC732]|uniref:Alpha/beta hydrolase n=1 Tax=Blastopirellula sediminis TaxID=2894196 RepID=A0A9X1MR85_9BACT|nr:alpha/beta hydrolase [Blastopirellula sediminis]MCC9604803.1 alpha/beta hydrolase [Blastopirellula sediminis]MCC9631898.1 alpha/beta hydrolase [Blastopirellula sediminis]